MTKSPDRLAIREAMDSLASMTGSHGEVRRPPQAPGVRMTESPTTELAPPEEWVYLGKRDGSHFWRNASNSDDTHSFQKKNLCSAQPGQVWQITQTADLKSVRITGPSGPRFVAYLADEDERTRIRQKAAVWETQAAMEALAKKKPEDDPLVALIEAARTKYGRLVLPTQRAAFIANLIEAVVR